MSRTGYIETKLKTLRKKLLLTEKAYKPREKKIDNEDHSDDETSSVTTSFGSEASTVDLRDAEEMKPLYFHFCHIYHVVSFIFFVNV